MEVVLTRLNDFLIKKSTFNGCKAAMIFQEQPLAEELCKDKKVLCDQKERLDIESSLAWLRHELMEMRSQDQALIRQLIDLHAGIQELKHGCALDTEDEDEFEDEDESWDSDSEASGGNAPSNSGEIFYLPSVYFTVRPNPFLLGYLPKKGFTRRSSVP